VALYYGKLLKYNSKNNFDEERDRFIISKGHGSISFYPILADLGFFDKSELYNIGKGGILGTIPDPIIPGYESVNGSLGHGLGVGSGMAIALKAKQSDSKVVVLMGDGELNEGSVWEAIMFAPQHNLDNLTLIIDNNKVSMLDFSEKIINLNSIKDKFLAFNWEIYEIEDGHNIEDVMTNLNIALNSNNSKPKVVIANTIKGKGVEFLEKSHLSHILSISGDKVDEIIKEIK
jgi:transketolase